MTFYRNSDSWNFAPGYADLGYPYLSRPVLAGCLQCHASGVQAVAETENKYADPPFREGGVACERCHGPGSDHIARGAPMVNPAKLAPAERDSVCEQCHLSGEIRVPKAGKDGEALSAGTPLDDLLTVFVRTGSEAELRVTSHAENLAASACKRLSGEKMWCGACHDPHSTPAPEEKAAYYRAKCLSCHAASDCGEKQPARAARNDDCTACHMPRNPPSDVAHVVFTDHSIRKRPLAAARAATRPAPKDDGALEPFRGGTADPRDLGLAYGMVGLRENNQVYLDRAFALLKQALEGPDGAAKNSADAEALAYLAQFYRDRKDDRHALPLYEQSFRLDPNQSAVVAALGAYWMQLGNPEQAALYWRRALAINPAMLLVRLNLGEALLRAGEKEKARAVVEKALEFDPAFQQAKDLLQRIAR